MISYSDHALSRIRERGITRKEVEETLEQPLQARDTRYGRKAACGKLGAGKYLVVIFERHDEDLIVVTVLKVNKGGLERFGFIGV